MSSSHVILIALSGPQKGARYKLVSNEVSLGRSSFCDLPFKGDSRMSRNQAKILLSQNGIKIQNLSQKTAIFVNGKKCSQITELKDEDKILLGQTKLQIRILNNSSLALLSSSSALSQQKKENSNSIQRAAENSFSLPENSVNGKTKKSRLKIYLIGGGVILFALLLMDSNQKPEFGEKLELLSQEKMDENLKNQREVAKKLQNQYIKSGKKTPQYIEARTHYIKGFRDYKKGKFQRAMTSFKACLALFPAHKMCRRYMKNSFKKINEIIQYYMKQGKKYEDQFRFSACQTAFRNAMITIQDRNDKSYKEAQAHYLICKRRWKNRF